MTNDYKVKDISLASWGRKEIILAEVSFDASTDTLNSYKSAEQLVAIGATFDEQARISAFKALFEVLNTKLAGVVTGVNIWAYSQWVYIPNLPYPLNLSAKFFGLMGTPTEASLSPYLRCNKSQCP